MNPEPKLYCACCEHETISLYVPLCRACSQFEGKREYHYEQKRNFTIILAGLLVALGWLIAWIL